MASEVLILDEAKREYRNIVEYLSRILKNPIAAKRFMDEFDQQLHRVSESPKIFALSRIRELALLEYRSAIVGNYLMLYTVKDDKVIIVHVFHQTQNYASLL